MENSIETSSSSSSSSSSSTFKLGLRPSSEQTSKQHNQSIMPVLSLGGVSVSTPQQANPLLNRLGKLSKKDSTVSLVSPLSSSPVPRVQSPSSDVGVSSDTKFKSLIKRNKKALFSQESNDLVDRDLTKSPDLNLIAARIITKSNRTNSPLLSHQLTSSVNNSKPASPSSTTLYELKEKHSNSDLKQLALLNNNNNNNVTNTNNSLMTTNPPSALSLDFTKTKPQPQQQQQIIPSAGTPTKLFPELNTNKPNSDLVTSTNLLTISNKNVLSSLNQAKRRILSVVDAKMKEEKDNRLKELELLNTIGTGTFGRVMCVKHKTTKKYFALKIMSIINIIKLKQVEHVKNEKNILESIHHPFIVKLFWTHHNDQFLYMTLEYVPGGELFSLLRQRGKFDSKTSVFYAAEIVCALEYLHNLQIVYRDLKPENILLDVEGHLKLTDFGFAKRITNKTYTLCGTPEYLAPEVILSRGHDQCCDWWTLGVIIFEFLSGTPPFFDENQYRVYEKILTTKIEWPRYFDSSAKDLIKKLLVSDPTKRLGSGNCGIVTPTSSTTPSSIQQESMSSSSEQSVVFLTESTDTFDLKDKMDTALTTPPQTNSIDKTSKSSSMSTSTLPILTSQSCKQQQQPGLLTQKQKIINGTEEIKRHRWFISIADWNDVYERRLPVPFKPEIQYEGDTHNFEKYDTPDLTKTPHATEKQLDVFCNF